MPSRDSRIVIPNRALGLPPHPIIGFIHREAIADAALTRADRFLLERDLRRGVLRDSRRPPRRGMDVAGHAVARRRHARRHRGRARALGGGVVSARRCCGTALTRPIERAAWHRMLDDTTPEMQQRWSERGVRWWAEHRLRRQVARDLENNTLHGAVRQMIRAGLPITAVLIAVHPIWGFSWYFNSENWATAAWQKIAETRVDEWRVAMIDAAVARPRRRRVSTRAGRV